MSLKKYFTLAKYIVNWGLYFKRKSDKGETVRYITKGTELAFDVPPAFYHVFREMFMEDFYDFKSLLKLLPAKPVVLDIGANVGYFTFQLLAARPQARVLAFEPMQKNIDLFVHNIGLNPVIKNSIQLNKQAVTGNNEGTIEIFFDGENGNSVIASVYKEFAVENTRSEIVDAVSLKSILLANQLAKIDLLKLDCEGSEYSILYNSPAEVFNGIHTIIIEVHPMDEETKNEQYLTSFLTTLGYSVTAHPGENGCPSLIAVKNAA